MSSRALKRFGKKAVAVLMALCLSVLMVPAAAFAAIADTGSALAPGGIGDGGATVAPASIDGADYEVEVDATAADASNTSGQNIATDKKGVGVLAKDGHTGTATVGNVSSSNTIGINGHANGGNVNITAKAITGSNYNDKAVWLQGNNATGTITVDSVNATVVQNGYNHNWGINADAGASADLSVTVNGGVTLNGVQNYTTGVYAKTTQTSAKSTVTINGDVSVTGGEHALYAHAYNGGAAKITAGNVTATDVAVGTVTLSAATALANGGTAELNIGNVEGKNETYVGMDASAKQGGAVTVNAGNISVSRESSYGMLGASGLTGSTVDEGSRADITVKNIEAVHQGVSFTAHSGTTLNLTTGNISGAGWNHLAADGGSINAQLGAISGAQHTGLDVHGTAWEGSHFDVTTGSITSENTALSFYTYASADNPDKITVNGNLTSVGGDYNGAGIYGSSSQGYLDLTVNGNVTSDYHTISGDMGGTAHITGDVISTHDGDYAPAIGSVAYRVPLDLLVEGTISANGPALSNNAENYSRLTLTTWKVASAKSELFQGDTDGTFAKRVNYIVKYEQPAAHGTISVTRADGKEFEKSHDFDVAHQGDRILVKAANLDPNWHLEKVYNGKGDDKVELPKDANGNFYLDVEDGGGIYLTAELKDTYTVKFVNYDDTVLQSKEYDPGATPKYEGETPAHPEDEDFVYVFTGWDPEIKAVTADATYKATYSVVIKPKSIANAKVTLSQTKYAYTAGVQKPTVTVELNGKKLTEGVEYSLAFSDENPEDVDVYKVTVTGEPLGYTDETTATFEIGHYDMSKFNDLDNTAWYLTTENGAFAGKKTYYLDYTLATGMMSGYTGNRAGQFGPNDSMSRAMVATVIYRLGTGKTAETTDNNVDTPFPDVPRGQWYTAAVAWCAEKGIITGYTAGPNKGKFCPDNDVSREDLATITGRYCTKVAGKPSAGTDVSQFSDATLISTYAKEGVAFCAANKIVSGYSDGTGRFDPLGNAKRCEASKIFAVTARLVK